MESIFCPLQRYAIYPTWTAELLSDGGDVTQRGGTNQVVGCYMVRLRACTLRVHAMIYYAVQLETINTGSPIAVPDISRTATTTSVH